MKHALFKLNPGSRLLPIFDKFVKSPKCRLHCTEIQRVITCPPSVARLLGVSQVRLPEVSLPRLSTTATIFALALLVSVAEVPVMGSMFIGAAEARVGRPASPGSVAGVARRTTRRTVRRHHVVAGTRVRVLPAGCTTVIRRGINYHHCGGYYYRPYYEGNSVVYVVENP